MQISLPGFTINGLQISNQWKKIKEKSVAHLTVGGALVLVDREVLLNFSLILFILKIKTCDFEPKRLSSPTYENELFETINYTT